MKKQGYRPDNDPLSRFGRKAKQFKPVFFFTFAALLIALNFRLITFGPLPLFLLSSAMWMIYLAITRIRCPQCNTRLLTRKSLKSLDRCYRCNFEFSFPEKPSTARFMETAEQKYPGKTDWTPLTATTANFDQYKLHLDQRGRLSFRPSWPNLSFGIFFAIFGLIFFLLCSLLLYNILPLALLVGFVSLLITLFGLYLTYAVTTPIVFDRAQGIIRLGRGRDNQLDHAAIKAVQLLGRQVDSTHKARTTGRSSYDSKHHMSYQNYQLNLVLRDGERRHVVSYFNRDKAIDAATQLADHIGVNLWNGLE